MEKINKYLIVTSSVILIGFFGLIGSCTIHRDYRVTQMVLAGTDPIKARLAVSNTLETDEVILYGLMPK